MSNQVFINATQKYPEASETHELVAGKWENDSVPGEFSTDTSFSVSVAGNAVTFLMQLADGTQSVAGALTFTELLPEKYRPAVVTYIRATVKVAGVLLDPSGVILLTPTGIIQAYPSFALNNFPIAATYDLFTAMGTYPHVL